MARKMKDSGIEWIGEIPLEWKVKPHKYIMYKIKEICAKFNGENIISLTLNGVIVRDLDNPKGKMPATFDGYQKVYSGNLLLCLFDIDVTPRCVGLIQTDGLTSPAYSQFVLKDDNNAKYFDYLLRMIDDKKAFLHLSKNLRSSLTESGFGCINTIVPPSAEQANIAEFLDGKCKRIDSIIENTKATIEEYKKYKQSVITEAVTKGLDPNIEMKDSGIEWIGEIPKHWEMVKLKYLVDLISEKVEYNGQFYIGLENIQSGNALYIETELKEVDGISNSFTKDDILFGKLRPYLAKALITQTNGICSSELLVLRHFKGDNRFLLRILLSYWFITMVTASTYGTKMPRANWNYIGNMLCPVCSVKEQQKIADYLDEKCNEIDNLLFKKQQIITELESYKKSLIYECVTGKLEV